MTKRTIEGEVINRRSRRQSLGGRLLDWSIRSKTLELVIGVPVMLLLLGAFYLWGWPFLVLAIATGLAYGLGWNAACREWQKNGHAGEL